MNPMQIAALCVIAAFYISYFTKMAMQRRKGIRTDQIGKGKKPRKLLAVELSMKAATYSIVLVETVSIIGNLHSFGTTLRWAGIAIAAVGVFVFVIAMLTMRDNWRAGVPETDKTELVTTGVYRFSRNPAFLGFDLMYAGLLIAFFNPVHLLFAVWAAVMLHLQIRQEEQFLTAAFGEEYLLYKKRTGRYFIL